MSINTAPLSAIAGAKSRATAFFAAPKTKSAPKKLFPVASRTVTGSPWNSIVLPALRELTTSVLLYGPTTRTIGVAIYTLNEDGETVYACALAGVALLLIVGGEILIKRFFEKKKRLDNGGA